MEEKLPVGGESLTFVWIFIQVSWTLTCLSGMWRRLEKFQVNVGM